MLLYSWFRVEPQTLNTVPVLSVAVLPIPPGGRQAETWSSKGCWLHSGQRDSAQGVSEPISPGIKGGCVGSVLLWQGGPERLPPHGPLLPSF